jgi:hypothetical protein
MPTSWHRPFRRAFRAGCYLLAHALVAMWAISLIAAVQLAAGLLGRPFGLGLTLFGVLPVSYILDAGDLAILIVLIFFGTIEAVRVLRENDDENDDEDE